MKIRVFKLCPEGDTRVRPYTEVYIER
jgi:hypothetical protein